jgi:CRP-like cAMP-binding protein
MIKLLTDSSATLFWLNTGEAPFRKPPTQPMAARHLSNSHGPALRAVDAWSPTNGLPGQMNQILTDEERARLAMIASVARFKKGAVIYREGDPADTVFNIISGVVKAYRSDGREHITGFLFPDDMFGLSEEGRYTNSIKAVTSVTAYRLPVSLLRPRLSQDADLEYHVICKLCHELRQAQRHGYLLARRQARSKLAMFLQFMEQLQAARSEPTGEIYLPMDRSDISEYVGMSLPAVSRAFLGLATDGIIRVRNRRHVKIVDRQAFERLAANHKSPIGVARSKLSRQCDG